MAVIKEESRGKSKIISIFQNEMDNLKNTNVNQSILVEKLKTNISSMINELDILKTTNQDTEVSLFDC